MFAARALGSMAGGVERTIIALLNEMKMRGHTVSLFSWDLAPAMAFYPIADGAQWHKLDLGDPMKKARSGMLFKRMTAVRRIVHDFAPEAIVCFQGGPFIAMRAFTLGMGVSVIAAERTAPTIYEHANSWQQQFIERQAFRTARLITVQFERYRTLYPPYLRHKIVSIPNPVRPAQLVAAPSTPGSDGRYRLLSVGRLGYQKNLGVLVRAFSGLAARHPDWDLRIIGEGEGRAELEAQIAALPVLRGRVSLPGATREIEAEYAAAHLFCLPSRWEGFPNALAEALAYGLPAVGFAGCAGVPDLIAAGRTGALAAGNNDPVSLARAIEPLLTSPERRAELGKAATVSMKQYVPARIFDLWEQTLLSVQRQH